ncbi:MAG: deoxyribose-phosphate aldolase [Anaerolineae bacterium]|nr:deoxyribose-phosphate aldolase [Anaerolineae bacterium]
MDMKSILEQAEAYDHQLPEFPGGLEVGSQALAAYLDSTILKPDATQEQIHNLCLDAQQYGFAAVCVNPIFTTRVTRFLKGSMVKNCTVVGFPLGAVPTSIKTSEALLYVKEGAEEVDMVIPVGLLKAGSYGYVLSDIAAVAQEAHKHHALLKVILEMGLLERREKIIGCLLSQAAGADFVKTSTGMMAGGATVEDVELMRRVVGKDMGVKAAGGIRSLADARAMLKAGANRLGTSAAVKIVQEAAAETGK